MWNFRGLIRVCVAVSFVSSTAFALQGKTSKSESSSPAVTSLCPCGQIPGKAQALSTWTISEGTNSLTNSGQYGAEWAVPGPNHNDPTCTIAPVNATDDVINMHVSASNGTQNNKLRVEWTATSNSSGSSVIYDPTSPSWWWQPAVTITDDPPVVEYKVGSGSWVNIGITADADPDPVTPGNPNDVRTSTSYGFSPAGAPAANAIVTPLNNASIDGAFQGGATITQTAAGVRLRVKVSLYVTVGGNADNAKVTNWRVWVVGSLFTNMTT